MGRPARVRWYRGRPPEVIADDHEHEHRGDEVQEQVDGVIAPGVEPGDRAVDGVGGQEDGAEVDLRMIDPDRVRIGEEAGDIAETPDRRVPRDPVRVVEEKADPEGVRVRDADPDDQESEKTAA